MKARLAVGVLRCSFCGKDQDAVSVLISSPKDHPGAYICDECVEACNSVLERKAQRGTGDSNDVTGKWFYRVKSS